MIKPYYKHEHKDTIVEVEDFGIINLEKIPILVHTEEKGYYEIDWAETTKDGETTYVLIEYGGSNGVSLGGRHLGVKKSINE